MAIMLEEIEFLELPDFFGRMPIDYPIEPIPGIGPFFEQSLYEVNCNTLDKTIEFFWDGALIGITTYNNWPEKSLPPYLSYGLELGYYYYATGKCFMRREYNSDNIAYCYPIQRYPTSAPYEINGIDLLKYSIGK
jgi:hypothetical protein